MDADATYEGDEGEPKGVQTLLGCIQVIALPLMVLNLLGGVASGVWLLLLGAWRLIIIGVLFFASSYGLSLVLAPSLLLTTPASRLLEKSKPMRAVVLFSLSNLYTMGVVTVWCLIVLSLCLAYTDTRARIPGLIWSYGIATSPWAYMANKDRDSFASSFLAFMIELAYAAAALLLILVPTAFLAAAALFVAVMLLTMVVQTVVAFLVAREYSTEAAERT